MGQGLTVEHVFVLGMPATNGLSAKTEAEIAAHGDMLVLAFPESRESLVDKFTTVRLPRPSPLFPLFFFVVIAVLIREVVSLVVVAANSCAQLLTPFNRMQMLRWANATYDGYTALLKLDDDAFLDMGAMGRIVAEQVGAAGDGGGGGEFFGGRPMVDSPVMEPSQVDYMRAYYRYHASRPHDNTGVFPPYVSGFLMVMSRATVRLILCTIDGALPLAGLAHDDVIPGLVLDYHGRPPPTPLPGVYQYYTLALRQMCERDETLVAMHCSGMGDNFHVDRMEYLAGQARAGVPYWDCDAPPPPLDYTDFSRAEWIAWWKETGEWDPKKYETMDA